MELKLDAAVMIILVITCITGYRRGFLRCLVGIVSVAVAVAVALWGSARLADPVYDRYLRDDVKHVVERSISDFDMKSIVMQKLEEQGFGGVLTENEVDNAITEGGDYLDNIGMLLGAKGANEQQIQLAQQSLDSYFDTELPESINEELEKQGMSEILNKVEIPKEELKECVSRIINQSSADAADYITQKTIKPVLVGIVRSAVFIACLIGASIVINIIVAIAGLRKPDHELSAADHFAGLVLGAIKGLLICAMFAWLLSTFCTLTDNSLKLFNSGVSDKTYLFRYFFDYFYR